VHRSMVLLRQDPERMQRIYQRVIDSLDARGSQEQ